jgi:hypothetical protein
MAALPLSCPLSCPLTCLSLASLLPSPIIHIARI